MANRSQLDQLVSYFASGKKAEFARILGISNQNLNVWYTREYLDIEKVYYACPGVSAEWLITGEGEMLTEKRSPTVLSEDLLIPFIHKEELLAGKWEESESIILARNCKDQLYRYDFITKIPGGDLSYYIYTESLIGCKIVGVDELEEHCLYIVRTTQGTFFVQYEGKEESEGKELNNFKTRRGGGTSDIKLALPPKDIVQCAEIADYSVNHFVEYVI